MTSVATAYARRVKYSPEQERDERGRFAGGGGGEPLTATFGPEERNYLTPHETVVIGGHVPYGTGIAPAVSRYEDPAVAGAVNRALRAGETPSGFVTGSTNFVAEGQQVDVAYVHRAMDMYFAGDPATLPHETDLYRAADAERIAALKPGDVFTDKGFTSTTYLPSRAVGIREGQYGDWHDRAQMGLLVVRAPEGTKVLPGASQLGELILDRGTQFRVLGQGTMHDRGDAWPATFVEVVK